MKFYKALEYDLYPDYDSVFGVAVTIKSINPSNAAFLANVSVAFPSEQEEAVKLNTSSIVVTKWLRNQIKIAGPPSTVRDIFFHYVLYDAKTMKKTPRVVRDTLELTLEYGFVKLYNEENERDHQREIRLETRFVQNPTTRRNNNIERNETVHPHRARKHRSYRVPVLVRLSDTGKRPRKTPTPFPKNPYLSLASSKVP